VLVRVCLAIPSASPDPLYLSRLVTGRKKKEEEYVERLSCGVISFEELNLRDRLSLVTVRGVKFYSSKFAPPFPPPNYRGSARDVLSFVSQ
jgi:hypothetical protein